MPLSKSRGAPRVSSVPTIAAAFWVVIPMRLRKSLVTATSVCEPRSGSRPESNVTGRSLMRLRSIPTSESKIGRPSLSVARAAAGRTAGGSKTMGVAMIGSTDTTSGRRAIDCSAASSMRRGGPGRGLSLSSATGDGAAASTLIPDSGPPSLT
jgi:hypothetical protein